MIGMTGYGEASGEHADLRLLVKVHGVNHRYLDIVARLPDDLRFAEARVRERVSAVAKRGRCEISVSLQRTSRPRTTVEIDQEAIGALHHAARPLLDAGLLRSDLTLGDLLRQPALVRIESAPVELDAEDEALLLRTVDAALAAFSRSRAADGDKGREAVLAVLGELETAAASLVALAPEAAARLATTLRARFAELGKETGFNEERWLHEAALLAEKGDVREEVSRLLAHLSELRAEVAGGSGSGRRIDFLAQELLRELNTLAAKCRDVQVVQTSLAARLLCEQIREQAQNVE